MKAFLYHMRPWQWYKNLVVFLALLVSCHLFEAQSVIMTGFAFILLCFLSSGNYMVNDVFDWKRDKQHTEKKQRMIKLALAFSGVTMVFLVLFVSSVFFPVYFTGLLLGLFVLSFLYSAFLKNVFLVDILVISINFVLRAIAGAYVVMTGTNPYIWVSPWLIICTFFLALFLAVGKRYGEFHTQKKSFRSVLKQYSPEITTFLLTAATVCLVVAYTLYSFLGEQPRMIFTLPVMLYLVFCYHALILKGNTISEKPFLIAKNISFMAGFSLWILMTFFILYV